MHIDKGLLSSLTMLHAIQVCYVVAYLQRSNINKLLPIIMDKDYMKISDILMSLNKVCK